MMPAVAWAVRCSPFFRQKFGLSKVDRWREFENLNSCLPALRASRDGVTGETAAFKPLPQKRRVGCGASAAAPAGRESSSEQTFQVLLQPFPLSAFRLDEAEKIGLGFVVPESMRPIRPNKSDGRRMEVAA
jgi:hypothetical protein